MTRHNDAMSPKEAQARIKINKLLEAAGWRFFDDERGRANVVLEPNVKLTRPLVDAMGNNFETTGNGFVDFLLLGKVCTTRREVQLEVT